MYLKEYYEILKKKKKRKKENYALHDEIIQLSLTYVIFVLQGNTTI